MCLSRQKELPSMWQKMPSQYPKQTKDFDSSNVIAIFKNYVFDSFIGWKLLSRILQRVFSAISWYLLVKVLVLIA
jgi:hypothetical protein